MPRGSCIWAHQAAEKAIKALLIARDVDPPKLHDLDRLVIRLPEADATAFDRLDLPELTRWSIEGRYPADLDEARSADVARALELARSVNAAVEARIDKFVAVSRVRRSIPTSRRLQQEVAERRGLLPA